MRLHAGSAAHFAEVAEQAKAGDVGHRLHPVDSGKRGASEVHLAHGLRRQPLMLRLEQRFFLCGGQHADPQRFGEIQFAARLRGAVFLDALGGHHAGDRQTEDRLRGVNGVAARQRDPRLLAGKAPALHHFAGDFRRQGVDRPAENGNRHNRFPAHGENIADGVGGGNAAKVERIIDNRHKKVGGADD